MSGSSQATWLATFGLLGLVLLFIFTRARGFAAAPLASPRMRRVASRYLPALVAGLVGCLVGIAVLAQSGQVSERAVSSGPVLALIVLAVLLSLVIAVLVPVLGFTLGERLKRRGELEAASCVTARAFLALLAGGVGVLITMFAAFALTNPAPGG